MKLSDGAERAGGGPPERDAEMRLRSPSKRGVRHFSDVRLLELVQSLTAEISFQRAVIRELREELLCLALMAGASRRSETIADDEYTREGPFAQRRGRGPGRILAEGRIIGR